MAAALIWLPEFKRVLTRFVTLNGTNADHHKLWSGFCVLCGAPRSRIVCMAASHPLHTGHRCLVAEMERKVTPMRPRLGSRPKRHQSQLPCLLWWRGTYSRRSAVDIRSAAISLARLLARGRRALNRLDNTLADGALTSFATGHVANIDGCAVCGGSLRHLRLLGALERSIAACGFS